MAGMRDPKTCNLEAFRKFGVTELISIASKNFLRLCYSGELRGTVIKLFREDILRFFQKTARYLLTKELHLPREIPAMAFCFILPSPACWWEKSVLGGALTASPKGC